jgi:hypothetical protein
MATHIELKARHIELRHIELMVKQDFLKVEHIELKVIDSIKFIKLMVVGHIIFAKGFLIIKNIIVNNNKVIQDIKLIIKRELKCINIMVV